jgi:sugar O-acyltransferase (sialic acid O-acetyltransferase NeuD family)
MRILAILGASGHGKVVADAAICSGWEEIIFFDDAWSEVQSICGWPVVGNTSNLINRSHRFDGAIVGIGNNAIRLNKTAQLKQADIVLETIIHPAAVISRYASIGQGSVVFAGAVLNSDCIIGESCIINTNATIEHDCVLGEGVHVSPNAGLGGQVFVGDLSWIGLGASVKQQIKIGSNVKVGVGAAVVSNIPDNVTVVGVPARIMERREG